jgi:threonine/homoserine efflux transporter RhtA
MVRAMTFTGGAELAKAFPMELNLGLYGRTQSRLALAASMAAQVYKPAQVLQETR